MKTKVLLVDDHAIVREGLRAILESQPDMEVVGEAQTGREALRQVKQLAPHVVLMDLAILIMGSRKMNSGAKNVFHSQFQKL